jgi:hypothetical protein
MPPSSMAGGRAGLRRHLASAVGASTAITAVGASTAAAVDVVDAFAAVRDSCFAAVKTSCATRAATGTVVPPCLVARHGTPKPLSGRASAGDSARRHYAARHDGSSCPIGPGLTVPMLVPGRAARLTMYRRGPAALGILNESRHAAWRDSSLSRARACGATQAPPQQRRTAPG